jgi:signal peptidase I
MPPPSRDPSEETYHRGRKRIRRLVAGAVALAGVAYCCLRWRPSRVEINGPSMEPSLREGDWALTIPLGHSPRVGDVLVVEHPTRPGFEMVKRVVAGPGGTTRGGRELALDEWWVEGDRPEESTDSRQFGPLRREHMKGRVRLVYWPPDRRRLL